MKFRRYKKPIFVFSAIAFSVILIVSFLFTVKEIPEVAETQGIISYLYSTRSSDGEYEAKTIDAEIGKDLTAVNISDLTDLCKITKVNYVADEYLMPGTLSPNIQIVDLTKPFNFAERGTLIFVITNLDPFDANFTELSADLDKYKIGDYWQFNFQLPEIFSASNIYLKAEIVGSHGEIENYDFRKYNTYFNKLTEDFEQETTKTNISLKFYTRREALATTYLVSQIVTIHYQSKGSVYSGIRSCPLVGTENKISPLTDNSQTILIIFTVLAAVTFAVLSALSFLERTKELLPSIIWTFGIMSLLFSRFLLSGTTNTPLFWSAVSLSMSFVILVGALFSVGRNFGKFPAKYISIGFAVAGGVLAFMLPFMPFDTANVFRIIYLVLKGICALFLAVFIGFATFHKESKCENLQTLCTVFILVAIIASLFVPNIYPAQANPLFWLCVVTSLMTLLNLFIVFTEIKKSNDYLTLNLHKEVERQVQDIKGVIKERDNLLQFVSHDMKKPLVASSSIINMVIERETDEEQTKALKIIKQNNERVVNNLSQIADFARFNYIAETSQVVDLEEICLDLFNFHQPDCNANGIVLKVVPSKNLKGFVKKQGLINVVSNLIINAIEHSNCKTITLSLKPDKDKSVLCVSDDGKGIDTNMDIFRPYVSENNSKTGGVGLYICKNIIESMNGELSYESEQGNTTFYISLLKA